MYYPCWKQEAALPFYSLDLESINNSQNKIALTNPRINLVRMALFSLYMVLPFPTKLCIYSSPFNEHSKLVTLVFELAAVVDDTVSQTAIPKKQYPEYWCSSVARDCDVIYKRSLDRHLDILRTDRKTSI